MCRGRPQQYFKKSPVVSGFPEEFVRIEQTSLRLVDEVVYDGKTSSEYEIVASTFVLLAVLLRQKPGKGSLEDETFTRLKTFLNSVVSGYTGANDHIGLAGPTNRNW